MGNCITFEIEGEKELTATKAPGSSSVDGKRSSEHKKGPGSSKQHSSKHQSGKHGLSQESKQSSRSDEGSQKGKLSSESGKGGGSKKNVGPLNPEDFSLPPDDNLNGVPRAKRLKLKDLQVATNDFDEAAVLGEGSFGKVYKGCMDEMRGETGSSTEIKQVDVAVKKLNPQSFQGYDEWLAEVLFLDKLRHPNLVRLVGYCAENGEALLAYELCHKGSLDHVFFSDREEDLFTWEQRVKVALDAAMGLAYLHENNVIHRDFKPSNILLDSDMTSRLTDFGMAKEGPEGGETHISTRVMGTLGYLDPAYMQTGRLTRKSDTYSYGVMLLELLSGRKSQEENLTKWARPLLAQRKPDVQQLMDPRLEDRYSKPGATKMAILAKHCIDDDPVSRPEMKVLVESLKRIVRES